MAPKRMSKEEKMQEMNEFFNLKELEKIGPKKGISGPHVKEVIDALVDENMISREKIGAANYYWIFPSQAAVIALAASEKVTSELSATEIKIQMAETSLTSAITGRESTPQRQAMLANLEASEKRNRELESELNLYRNNDEGALDRRMQMIKLARDTAIAHTENISAIISFAKNQFQADPTQLRGEFDLPADFEEIEDLPVLIGKGASKQAKAAF